jgi:hypothetical protein
MGQVMIEGGTLSKGSLMYQLAQHTRVLGSGLKIAMLLKIVAVDGLEFETASMEALLLPVVELMPMVP